jgi:nitrate reductase assembly molybdenum cofactor insertion protein NarJ
VLLRLLGKLEDEELRLALIGEILIPALARMLDALSQTENPYRDLIEVINSALKNELPEESVEEGRCLTSIIYSSSSFPTP